MLKGNCKYSIMFAKVQSKLTELLTRCNQDTARPHLLPTLVFNLKFTSWYIEPRILICLFWL